MKPIIPPKYDIGFIIKNSDIQVLAALEPWCNTLYADKDIKAYIDIEQENTIMDLHDRVKPYDNEKNNGILIEIDGSIFTQQDAQIIENLSLIIQDSGETGKFEIGNLKVNIINLEKETIKC